MPRRSPVRFEDDERKEVEERVRRHRVAQGRVEGRQDSEKRVGWRELYRKRELVTITGVRRGSRAERERRRGRGLCRQRLVAGGRS